MIIDIPERFVTLPGERCYVAPTACLIGAVTLEEMASVWFGAVLRAEHMPVTVGAFSNIQDGAVVHTDERAGTIIGKRVTVGHRAILHSCSIGDDSLVGINAVVLNGAVVGRGCIIGACSLVTENTIVPDNSLVLGSPGKVVRPVSEDQAKTIDEAWRHYVKLIDLYRRSGSQ